MANNKISATVEQALQNAGTTVLSHFGGVAKQPTVADVEKFRKDTERTVIGYVGPYTDPDDERNGWTYQQDLDAIPPAAPGTATAQKKKE